MPTLSQWIDVLTTILSERAVRHHGELPALITVVDGDDHGEVVLDGFAQLERCQVIDVELDGALGHFLIQAGPNTHIVDVVLPIGRIEHLWCIIRVLLLRYAHVDADMRVADCIVLEGQHQLVIFVNVLQ